ncbi:hypothetical protein [Faecalimonas sp.]
MIVVKLKIVFIPIVLILSFIKWFGVFITTMSSIVFYLLAGIIFVTGILGYGFGLETGRECLRILLCGFIVFMLPVIVTGVISGIACIQTILIDFIWS